MDHRLFFLQKNGWRLSPKFQSNVFGSSKGLKEGFLYSFGQKTARVPWQNSFNLMLILKCQWQICLICTNIREIKFHLVIMVHLVYLFLPFLSRVKLNFLSIDWIQWSLWFPMNIQGLFYHFTTFAWCVSQGRWIEVILQTQAILQTHRDRWLSWLSIGLSCGRSWVQLRPNQHSGS